MNIEDGIWLSIKVTKNLGNYENIVLEAGASQAGVDPKDAKAWSELWTTVDDQVAAKIAEVEGNGG